MTASPSSPIQTPATVQSQNASKQVAVASSLQYAVYPGSTFVPSQNNAFNMDVQSSTANGNFFHHSQAGYSNPCTLVEDDDLNAHMQAGPHFQNFQEIHTPTHQNNVNCGMPTVINCAPVVASDLQQSNSLQSNPPKILPSFQEFLAGISDLRRQHKIQEEEQDVDMNEHGFFRSNIVNYSGTRDSFESYVKVKKKSTPTTTTAPNAHISEANNNLQQESNSHLSGQMKFL